MMKYFKAALIVFLLQLIVPNSVQAQFWKNSNEKDHKTKKKPADTQKKEIKKDKPESAKTKKESKNARESQLDYPLSVIKPRYRIDVLTPLYLNELIVDGKKSKHKKVLDQAGVGLNLYEGIKLAADTLNLYGYQLDVFVHDISDVLSTPETLVNTGALDSSDLIIGAVGAQQVAVIARFAKKKKINFVSILSPFDGEVSKNYFFTLIQPTLQTHCEWIRKDAASRYPNRKFTVYHRPDSRIDEEAYDLLIPDRADGGMEVKCTTQPKREQLALLFDSSQINVVMMPILDPGYASMLLKQLVLEFPGYHFEVYGMPSWKSMDLLRSTDALQNIIVMVTSPFYFDSNTPSGKLVFNRYQKTYGGYPSEMVFRGYESLQWYAYLLDKYGTIYNGHQSDNTASIWTHFEIKPRFNKDGDLLYNENKHLYLYRFTKGAYTVTE